MACECYSTGRYLTVTGNRLGTATEIIANQPGIDEVHHAIFEEWLAKRIAAGTSNGNGASHSLDLSDRELLEIARKAANGDKFAKLYDDGNWSGAGYPSASEADVALAGWIGFYTGRIPSRIDSLFRASALYREKWDRADYRARTIAKALEGRTEFYSGARVHQASIKAPSPDSADQNGWEEQREKIKSGDNGASPPPTNDSTRSSRDAKRPRIVIQEGRIFAMIDEAERALLPRCEDLGLFQAGGEIVLVSAIEQTDLSGGLNRPAGAVHRIPVPPFRMLDILDREIEWVRPIKQKGSRPAGERPADCKLAYAQRLLARRGDWRLPELRGVIEAPLLHHDGSILSASGYDETTGLYLHTNETWNIPEKPSYADAQAALTTLLAPFNQFPFRGDTDRSVHLAALLTASQRRQLETAPLFAYDATDRGTGKSLLAESNGWIAMGRSPVAIGVADDENEFRKCITSALREGHLIVNLDNLTRPLESPDLARALTQTRYGDRLLGSNTNLVLLTNIMWTCTMTNFRAAGDLVRRVLVCRLDAKSEHPEERVFEIADLPAHLRENRKQLVTAALTILRAFHVAGRPRQNLRPFGSFDQWSREIREPIVWLALADPCASREFLVEGDSDRDTLGAILAAWHDAFGSKETPVNQVIGAVAKNETCTPELRSAKLTALRDALLLVAARAEKDAPDRIDPRRLGAWLRDQGAIVDSLRFERGAKRNRAVYWRVAVVEQPATNADDKGERPQ